MKGVRGIISLIVLFSLVSAGVAFYAFYVARDYTVTANVSCDPAARSCFLGDGEDTPSYYKIVSRKANTIPACDGWAGECAELACEENNPDCSVEYCVPGGEEACSESAP